MTATAVMKPLAAASGTDARLAPGIEVGGYVIDRELGSGAMGTVYAARDGAGNQLAIKFLRPDLEADADGRAVLEREVAALRRLKHPAVVRVIDAELDGPDAFVVTELVDGVDLQTEIDERGALDPLDLFELADQLASALEAVHLAGVVHRDLKPSNVMVTDRGPVLIDFGIAADPDTQVRSDRVVGTPGYLDPELVLGASPTVGTDWWSWAAVLAFAATGRAPFGAVSTDDIIARTRDGRADLVGLRPRTAQALAAALHPVSRSRWTPAEVLRELRRDADAYLAATQVGAASPAPPPPPVAAATHRAGSGSPSSQTTQALPSQAAALPAAPTSVLSPGGTKVLPPQVPSAPKAPAPRRVSILRVDSPAAAAPGIAPVVPPTAEIASAVLPGTPATQLLPTAQAPGQASYRDAPRFPVAASGQPSFAEAIDPNNETPHLAPVNQPVAPVRLDQPRPGLAAALLLPLAVLAGIRPLFALAVLALVVVAFRVVGVAVDDLAIRRYRAGRRRGTDGVVVAAKLPVNLLRGALGALPQLLLGAAAGVVVAAGLFWLFAPGRLVVLPRPDFASQEIGGVNQMVIYAALLALAMAVAGLATWFGTNSRQTRLGARWVANTLVRGHSMTALVIAVALMATVLAARGWFASPVIVDWWPFGTSPLP